MKNKTIYALFLLFVVATLVTACSSSAPVDESEMDVDRNVPTDTQTTETTNTQATQEETSASKTDVSKATMKVCISSDDAPAHYEYYISDDAIYEYVETGNTGWTAKLTTVDEICTKMKGNDMTETWQCMPNNQGQFDNYYIAVTQQMTSGPLAEMNGISCTQKDLDDSKFEK